MIEDLQKWDRIASKYDQSAQSVLFKEGFLYPLILKFLKGVKGKKILDAGCATGVFSRILAKKGTKVYAVDGSKEMIKIAQKQSENGIKYQVADLGKDLPFSDNFFDLVVSIHVLMDIQNYQKALFEFHRVLRRGGKLVFSISHPCFTVPTLNWKRGLLGRFSVNYAYAMIDDYFKRRKIEKYLVDKKSATPHYHRPVEDYINGLVKAGFQVSDVQEPKMPKELAKKTHLFLADKVPLTLIIGAVAVK